MDFETYLKSRLHKVKLPGFKSACYTSLTDFFDKVVKPNLPSKEILKKWHHILMSYVRELDFPVYAIRKFGSYDTKVNKALRDYSLRRGFLTKSDSYAYFFVDNYFSKFFALMAKDNYAPTFDEFIDAFTSSKYMPCCVRETKAEIVKRQYGKGKMPSYQYKLSHVFSANENYLLNGKLWKTSSIICDTYFPRGDYNDWIKNSGGNYERKFISEGWEPERLIKAMFLRCVHPFNYFWTPKGGKNGYQYSNIKYPKNDIGEYKQLINLVHDYYLKLLPDEYREFMEMICLPNYDDATKPLFNNNDTVDITLKNDISSKEVDSAGLKKKIILSSGILSGKIVKGSSKTVSSSGSSSVVFKKEDRAYKIVRKAIENGILTQDGVIYFLKHGNEVFGTTNPVLTDDLKSADPTKYHLDPAELVTFNGKQYAILSNAIDNDKINKWEESLSVKVMEYAYVIIKSAVEIGNMSSATFAMLTDKKGSKQLLGCYHPVLVKTTDPRPANKYNGSLIITYKGVDYNITNDWYDRNRAKLISFDLAQTYTAGELIRKTIISMFKNGQVNQKLIDLMTDEKQCHLVSKQNKPFVMKESTVLGNKVLERVYNGRKLNLVFNGDVYLLWNQWRAQHMHDIKLWVIKNLPF